MRYFISYRRKLDTDRTLANFLCAGLQQEGHDVFIDVGIPVGTNWAEEISHRIDWCDFLVVLLSAESVESEMVQGEVRLAHHRRRPDGRPRILPIRVCFDGPLDYELNCYVGPLQYLSWNQPGDSQCVLESLKTAVPPSALTACDIEPVLQPPDQPSAIIGSRWSKRAPGGGMKPDDPFYINRPADRLVADRAELTGETLVIKAPRQMGKTSLLNRYLHKCDGADKRWALVDFQCFTNDELENYSIFLGQLASALARSLGIDEGCVPEFASQQQFNFFVEDHLIRSAGDPIVLAFDEVDRVLGRAYQQDFFSMLRVWHNSRSRPRSRWEDVDLVLVIATEPYLLINRGDQSPFNVTPAIELGPFPLSALEELNVRYGGILNSAEIERVFELLGGHPYLTQLAFYRLHASTGMAFDQLMEHAVAPDGPFGEHLRRLLLLLQEQSGLMAALRQVIAKGTVSSEDHYHRLHGAGLVLRKKERVVPSNLLYARFFRGIR